MRKMIIAILAGAMFVAPVMAQTIPGVPDFPRRTNERVFQQIGECHLDLADVTQWTTVLLAEIQKRDKEIERLKTVIDEKGGKSKKDDKSKPKE